MRPGTVQAQPARQLGAGFLTMPFIRLAILNDCGRNLA